MPEYTVEDLEKQLRQFTDAEISARAVRDIHSALQIAEILESKGFSFKLKDLCPKSLNDTLWRAVFSKDAEEFNAKNEQSALAVCAAAIQAFGACA